MEKKKKDNREAFIRSDGWVFTKEGMDRLVKGGKKGHELYEKSMESQIGKRWRVSKPLDREAAQIVMSIKGVVPRAVFVSQAIVEEAERRAKKGDK